MLGRFDVVLPSMVTLVTEGSARFLLWVGLAVVVVGLRASSQRLFLILTLVLITTPRVPVGFLVRESSVRCEPLVLPIYLRHILAPIRCLSATTGFIYITSSRERKDCVEYIL